MIFFEIAKRNLKLHTFRSLLAIIGVIIGVASIASMGILGNGLVQFVSKDLTKVSDTLVVTMHVGGGSNSVNTDEKITQRRFEDIKRAAAPNRAIPVYQTADRMKVGDKDTSGVIYGLNINDMPEFLEVKEGVFLRGESGCMAGAKFAEENNLKPGSLITVNDKGNLRVSAILKERGMGFDINPDYGIVVSDKWFSDNYQRKDFDTIVIKVNSLSDLDLVKAAIEKKENQHDTMVDVIDTRKILETIIGAFERISVFVTAIGGISLIVAGVSILNVMLMSVTERTKEVGIMRSIGALRSEVRIMFLYEAFVLGLMGSIIGAFIAFLGGLLVSALMLGTTEYVFTIPSLISIGQGMAFGIIICMISGFYPAWKASNLNPIDALHFE